MVNTDTITEEIKVNEAQNPQDVQNAVMLFMMETLKDLKKEIEALKSGQTVQTAPAAKVGRPRSQGNPHIDTRTGIVYRSKAAAAKAVWSEYEGKPIDGKRNFTWHGWAFHDIQLVDPRFIEYRGNKEHGQEDIEYIENIELEAEIEAEKAEETKTEVKKAVADETKKAEAPVQTIQKPAQKPVENRSQKNK